ncbi:uncharacterized protein LOC133173153 [Saccostrea echinata]|uniref:uncharacterized protein LOC133173153 n=1 Tax=Saccostrea echinata TaxID=191078 RepID=UPI002A7EA799|nr:uncharacterized protein LOC133173153 [Saccostrea echinata]
MNEEIMICVFLWMSAIIIRVQSCTLPTDWDGEWHDSSDTTQDITFTLSDKYVVGWKHQIYSATITSWTCIADKASDNLLLFKSNQTTNVFGADHNVYRCLKWQKLTDYSYTYLIHANNESNAGDARVLVQTTTDVVNVSYACNPSQGLPTAVETVVMIKKDYILNATQNCPTPFLGSFNYTFNDGSTTYCDGTSVWDVCSDRTQMVVNYTLCSTQQFYSAGGVAYCAYSTSVGSNYYVTVINADTTVDFTTTHRFTCYAVTSFGGKVFASDNKGACGQSQTPTSKMSTGAGTLEFVAYETCHSFTSAAASESSSNIGIIAGAVVGVIVIAVAVTVGIVIYKKYKAKINPREHSDEEKVQPPDPAVTPRDATVIEPPADKPNTLPPLQK